MATIRLPANLSDRYELLADELDGFDDADDLAEYVLESTAAEIERGDSSVSATGSAADSADDDVVEDRLEQLGYLEK
jgi:hypothetical protein